MGSPPHRLRVEQSINGKRKSEQTHIWQPTQKAEGQTEHKWEEKARADSPATIK